MRMHLKELTYELKEICEELQWTKAPPMALSLSHKHFHKLDRVFSIQQSSCQLFDICIRECSLMCSKQGSQSIFMAELVDGSFTNLSQDMTMLSGKLCLATTDTQALCDRVISLLQQLVDIELQKRHSPVKGWAIETSVILTAIEAHK